MSDTWTAKEVFADLKTDLMGRLDKQDVVLDHIERRLDNTATKEDIHAVHQRIDGVEGRIVPLEQAAADEKAVEQSRARFRANLAWVAGILGACGVIAAVVVPIVH